MSSVAPEAMVVEPTPPIVPPAQDSWPWTVKSLLPFRVSPLMAAVPETVNGLASVSVPSEKGLR